MTLLLEFIPCPHIVIDSEWNRCEVTIFFCHELLTLGSFPNLCNCVSIHLAGVILSSIKIFSLFHYVTPESTHIYNLLVPAINDRFIG
jgi:hypothetical protein